MPQYVRITKGCNISVLENNKETIEFEAESCNCSTFFNTEDGGKEYHTIRIFDRELNDEEYKQLISDRAKVLKDQITSNEQSLSTQYFMVDKAIEREKSSQHIIDYLDDSFLVYNKETGQSIFVDVYPSKGKLNNDQLKGLATSVLQKSGFENNNIIYISIPCWTETHINNILRSTEKQMYEVSYETQDIDLKGGFENINKSGKDILQLVNELYSTIPKPHVIIQYLITYRGDIIEDRIKREDNITGFSQIYDFRLTIDKRVNSFVNLAKAVEGNRPESSPMGTSKPVSVHQINAFARAQEGLRNFLVIHPSYNPDVINHCLFESKLSTNNKQYSEGASKYVLWYRSHLFKGLTIRGVKPESPNIPDEWFYTGKNEIIYQENLTAIDLLGASLAPFGLDIIADVIGTVYTGYYGEWGTSANYISGIFAPVVTGGALKITRNVLNKLIQGKLVFKWVDGSFILVESNRMVNEELVLLLKKYAPNNNTLVKYHDEIIGAGIDANKIDDQLAELLVKSGNGRIQVLSQISGWSDDLLT